MAYLSQQIRDLRKQGNLEAAYRLASQAHRENPNDRYITSELTWVLYYCLKRYGDPGSKYQGDIGAYTKTLGVIERFNIDMAGNEMFYDNLSKNIASVAWDLVRREDGKSLYSLFEVVVRLSDRCPDLRNAILLKAFLKGFNENARATLNVIAWYDLRSFTDQDCADESYQGKQIPGIAETTVNAYLDALVKQDRDGRPVATREEQDVAYEQVTPFLTRRACLHWNWLRYKLGKLLTESNKQAAARGILEPFLLANQSQGYAWAAYADACLPEQPALYRGCLFKALTLSPKIEYALSYHEKALNVFVEEGNLPAAKTEAVMVSQCRSERGWKSSQLITSVERAPWYPGTVARESNADLYEDYAQDADAVLAKNVPAIDFYVEWVDRKKGMLGVVTPKVTPGLPVVTGLENSKRTVIKDKRKAAELTPGEVYTGSLSLQSKQIYGEVQPSANQRMRATYIRHFEGIFNPVGAYGFVRLHPSAARRSAIASKGNEGVFIPPSLVTDHEIAPRSLISGRQVAVFRRKKGQEEGEWKWEARIDSVTPSDPSDFEAIVQGAVRLTLKGDGFVGKDGFIPGPLVAERNLRMDDWVKAKQLRVWNKKKEQWGWRVTEILEHVSLDDGTLPEDPDDQEEVSR